MLTLGASVLIPPEWFHVLYACTLRRAIGIDYISIYVISYHIAKSVINSLLKCVFQSHRNTSLCSKGLLFSREERNSSKKEILRWRLRFRSSSELLRNIEREKHDDLAYHEFTGGRSGFWDFSLHRPSIEVSAWKHSRDYRLIS